MSRRFGLTEHVTFSGSLAWPYFYPYPQRPAGLIEECFAEQARRWKPILDAYDEAGVDLCYEIHPSEDMFDGDTFEMFLEAVGNHPRCNINYDASHYIKQCDGLSRLHRRLSRAHQDVPREGRRVQPDGAARAPTAATRAGSSAPAATARSAGARSTSRASSRSSRPTISPAGPSTNGNAAWNIPRWRPGTARSSSPTTSSR